MRTVCPTPSIIASRSKSRSSSDNESQMELGPIKCVQGLTSSRLYGSKPSGVSMKTFASGQRRAMVCTKPPILSRHGPAAPAFVWLRSSTSFQMVPSRIACLQRANSDAVTSKLWRANSSQRASSASAITLEGVCPANASVEIGNSVSCPSLTVPQGMSMRSSLANSA